MNATLQTAPAAPFNEHEHLQARWAPIFILGLISVIVGVVAIGSPHVATEKTVMVLGIVLLIAGAAELVHSILARSVKGFALHLLSAALYLVVGLFMIEDPIRVGMLLTLLLAASFLVAGILRVITAALLQFAAWTWVLLNGIVDIGLGILILNGWPESSLWVLGLFVGIDLLFHGWSWMILALTVRNYEAIREGA